MPNDSNKNALMQYATLASQIAVALIVTVYAGKWIDGKHTPSKPLWIWVLPLIALVAMMYKIIKATSKNK